MDPLPDNATVQSISDDDEGADDLPGGPRMTFFDADIQRVFVPLFEEMSSFKETTTTTPTTLDRFEETTTTTPQEILPEIEML